VVAGHDKTSSSIHPAGERIPAGIPPVRAEISHPAGRDLSRDPGQGCFGRSRSGHSMEAPMMKYEYQASRVKDHARGRWAAILQDLAPALTGCRGSAGQACPLPGPWRSRRLSGLSRRQRNRRRRLQYLRLLRRRLFSADVDQRLGFRPDDSRSRRAPRPGAQPPA
jgi:hypothetical protein